MLLTKVAPEQLHKVWSIIRYSILQASPVEAASTPEGMQHVIVNLLNGKAQAWLLHDNENISTVGITYIATDQVTNGKYLLLYVLYGVTPTSMVNFEEAYAGLAKYGKANGCDKMLAYTSSSEVKALAERFGFSVENFVLAKEL